MTMVLTGVAIVLLGWIDENRRQWLSRHSSWSPLLLMLAVVSLGCLRPLLHTYRLFPWLEKGNEQNFNSGFRRGDEQMSFSVLPEGGIVTEEPIPLGIYTRPPVINGFSYDVYPYYLLGFFDKQTVVIKSLNTDEETAPAKNLPQ